MRNEVDVLKEIPWLKEEVVKDIRNRGEFCIICDHHICDISKFSIPYKYWTPIKEWARKEGFRVCCECNSYGVRHLVIRL